MKCKCKYYLMSDEGVRVCSVCGRPAHSEHELEDKQSKAQIEDKAQGKQSAPLYISDKDKVASN